MTPLGYRLENWKLLRGFLVAELLALDHAGISRQQAGVAERRLEVGSILFQGSSQAEHDRAGLAELPAAVDVHENVDSVQHLGELQWCAHIHLLNFQGEIFLEVQVVDLKLAGSLADPHAGDRSFSPSGTPGVSLLCRCRHLRRFPLLSLIGSRGHPGDCCSSGLKSEQGNDLASGSRGSGDPVILRPCSAGLVCDSGSAPGSAFALPRLADRSLACAFSGGGTNAAPAGVGRPENGSSGIGHCAWCG